jgi:hypothetical protein
MVWLYRSPIPVGRRGVISSFKWFLPPSLRVEGGGGSAPCVRKTVLTLQTLIISRESLWMHKRFVVEENIISGLYARTSGLGPHTSSFCPMQPPGACYVERSNVKTADFSPEVAFIRRSGAGIADFRHVSADNANACRLGAAIASFSRRGVVVINRIHHKATGVKQVL